MHRAFICTSCEDKPEFGTAREVKAHLRDTHKIETVEGKRKMTMALDGAGGWFRNTFEWAIGDVILVEVQEGKSR